MSVTATDWRYRIERVQRMRKRWERVERALVAAEDKAKAMEAELIAVDERLKEVERRP